VDPHVKCPPHYQALSEEFDDSKYITPCQRECPLGTYSDPEYKALSITQIVEGYFGAVMLVVVLIPFFINFSETNMFPHVVPLYIYISSGLMALGFIWPSFLGGFDEVTCEKDFIVADVTYFPCAVQGPSEPALLFILYSLLLFINCYLISLLFVFHKSNASARHD
jgi:hypothetical protein